MAECLYLYQKSQSLFPSLVSCCLGGRELLSPNPARAWPSSSLSWLLVVAAGPCVLAARAMWGILWDFQLFCPLRCLFCSLGVTRCVALFPIQVCEWCDGAVSSPRDSSYRFGGIRWKERERAPVIHHLDKIHSFF